MRGLLLATSAALSLNAALPSQQEALALAFPGAAFTRKDIQLSPDQAARVKALSQRAVPGPLTVVFEARQGGTLSGVAFFESHRVRTQNETTMVAVSPDGSIRRVEVVAFGEPPEYMARSGWMRQMDGKRLGPDLALGRSIKPLSGATLTANALTDASRRALALFQVLYGPPR